MKERELENKKKKRLRLEQLEGYHHTKTSKAQNRLDGENRVVFEA